MLSVEALTSSATADGAVVRRVALHHGGVTVEARVEAPGTIAGDPDDITAAVALALWPAILRGSDVHVAGSIERGHLARLRRHAHVLASWLPGTHLPAFTAATEHTPVGPTGQGRASFFSRGVDSMFEAALDRSDAPPLDALVFLDGIEPRHSPAVAAEEVALARQAADRLGLPLHVVRTDVHSLTGEARDWADVHGTVLASLGTCLGGAIGTVVIPSTDSYGTIVPYGSHPLLDPLLSRAGLAIEHGDLTAGRAGKVRAIAMQRPDLLPLLKVCYAEDRPDNCGRCGKCTITMAALAAVGALEAATGFPDSVDLEVLRSFRPAPLQSRQHWVDVLRLLDETGRAPAVREAIAAALRDAASPPWRDRLRWRVEHRLGRRPSPHPSWKDPARGIDWAAHSNQVRLVDEGVTSCLEHPLPPLPDPLRSPAQKDN